MGKMMGAFDSENDMLDRPDLNKCPDCGCFFAQDNCPLCGKPCPEEMRAGNRTAPKKQKYKYDNGYRTVMFVDWYHRWWFIALMALIHPIISIVLLITSPHKKKHKIIAVILAVLYGILTNVAFPFLIAMLNKPKAPVDASLSKAEYIAVCETVDPEEFYRYYGNYSEDFVSMELTVKNRFTAEDYYYVGTGLYRNTTYYICTGADGKEIEIMLCDYLLDGTQNFLPGDTIKIYGEGGGHQTVYDNNGINHSAPLIYMAYAERIR